ncbi:unnamed protein product [Thelazia callipaeda]|uniref:AKAP2_C domain-containing protein n=1 Tax=Thelazia callipaeda TaxID=103827 RepID=A0A0N5D205_THECL|nr:unnamed protein product [Thelazia callipaeda]
MIVIDECVDTMADRELAAILEKRLAKLKVEDVNTIGDTVTLIEQSKLSENYSLQSPTPPPKPSGKQQMPSSLTIPDNEWIDMDKLIRQTLHNMEERTSRNTSITNTEIWMKDTTQVLKQTLPSESTLARFPHIASKDQMTDESDRNERNDSLFLPSKSIIPIVPILHQNKRMQKESKKFFRDHSLDEISDELNAKLAKQRNKSIQSVAVQELIESRNDSEANSSRHSFTPIQSPPAVLPKTLSFDCNSLALRKTESFLSSPPQVAKKPAYYMVCNI